MRWEVLLQARDGYDNPVTSAEPRDTQLKGRLLQTQGWVETCPVLSSEHIILSKQRQRKSVFFQE